MSKRRRRKFANEFKAETVKLILGSGKTVAEVARLGLYERASAEQRALQWRGLRHADAAGSGPRQLLSPLNSSRKVKERPASVKRFTEGALPKNETVSRA